MVKAWHKWFDDLSDVTISQGDIFGTGEKFDAIVSPANSFGFMDGGIDLAYSKHFATKDAPWGLQERLQAELQQEHDGELPVGQAVIIKTGKDDIKWLISAPTMRIPMPVMGTVNAYLAFRAVIRGVTQWNEMCEAYSKATDGKTLEDKIETILCPGLGTAVGQMPVDACAKQMFYAYMTNWKKDPKKINNLGEAMSLHYGLTRNI